MLGADNQVVHISDNFIRKLEGGIKKAVRCSKEKEKVRCLVGSQDLFRLQE